MRIQKQPLLGRLTRRRDTQALAGVLDPTWYSREVGESFSGLDQAVEHYRDEGDATRFSPHPLFSPSVMPEDRDRTPLARYLLDPKGRPDTSHPAWDAVEYVRLNPEAGAHPQGPLGHLAPTLGPDTTIHLATSEAPAAVRWGDVAKRWDAANEVWARAQRLRRSNMLTTLPAEHVRPDLAPPKPTDSTLVSIVMPTRDRPGPTARALASIQDQSWSHWEVLVVDDGSTDDTRDTVRAMASDDARIQLIERPHEGVCAARNSGLAAARGGFIAFLDSDNVWDPHFLETMVAQMTTADLAAAHGTLVMLSPQGRRYRAGLTDADGLLFGNQVDLNVLMVRADLMADIGGFDVALRRMVDYDLVLRIMAKVPLVHVPVFGAIYDDEQRDDRITVREPVSWGDVVRLKHRVDWSADAAASRDPELLSVILPTNAPHRLRGRLRTLQGLPETVRWEAVVVDVSPAREVLDVALGQLVTDDRISYLRLAPTDSLVFATGVGFGHSRGAQIFVLDPDSWIQLRTLPALLAAAEARGSSLLQPALLTQKPAKGQQFPDPRTSIAPATFDGWSFLVRAVDFASQRGLDPLVEDAQAVIDLALRLEASGSIVGQIEAATIRSGVRTYPLRTSTTARELFAARHPAWKPTDTEPSAQ